MGKTQLVLSFAYSVVEQHPDTSVFWIPALSAETFERAAKKIAEQLGLRSPAEQSEDAKELVKRYLSSPCAGSGCSLSTTRTTSMSSNRLRKVMACFDTYRRVAQA